MTKMGAKPFEKDFVQGECRDCYRYLGNHRTSVTIAGTEHSAVSFSVWAPHAKAVRVVGDFNGWGVMLSKNHLQKNQNGIWRLDIPDIPEGSFYKYAIEHEDGTVTLKNDPMAVLSELRPGTASVIYDLPDFPWTDGDWLVKRANTDYIHSPVNIYEVHAGSWRRGRIPGIDYENNWQEAEARKAEEPFYNYRELADQLASYLPEMHYTHVELMPVCEHPLDGSWGYQTGNYYSVTSRYGTPSDFQYFVNRLHSVGIGVILDWVPGHFCKDEAWLSRFDGTYQYEYSISNLRENPLWGTSNFNLTKGEVRSFLISNAVFWLSEYHVDGLRVDAVANLLYLDYDNVHCVHPKNIYGGRENLDGISFLRDLNTAVHSAVQNPLMIAEDSSAWPMVTKPVYLGGLGFDFKWNMGWMNDTLVYMRTDPVYRSSIHNKMTFSMVYAFSENYVLPISHDEVVHGKKTLLDKMFGGQEEKFAALRAYYLFMMGHPGKKLLFMGNEFGQYMEWRYYEALEWKMLLYPPHGKLKEYVRVLNDIYISERACYELDDTYDGFFWIDADNASQNVFSFVRRAENPDDLLVFVINMSPVPYQEYKIGVPRFADYREILNSNDSRFGGSGKTSERTIRPGPQSWNGQPFHIKISLPAYGALIFKPIIRKNLCVPAQERVKKKQKE